MSYIKYKDAVYVSAQREISLATVLEQLKFVQAQLKLAQPGVSRDALFYAVSGAQELLWQGMQTLKLYMKAEAREREMAEKLEAERLSDEAFARENK